MIPRRHKIEYIRNHPILSRPTQSCLLLTSPTIFLFRVPMPPRPMCLAQLTVHFSTGLAGHPSSALLMFLVTTEYSFRGHGNAFTLGASRGSYAVVDKSVAALMKATCTSAPAQKTTLKSLSGWGKSLGDGSAKPCTDSRWVMKHGFQG